MVYKERGYFMNLVRNFRGKFTFLKNGANGY